MLKPKSLSLPHRVLGALLALGGLAPFTAIALVVATATTLTGCGRDYEASPDNSGQPGSSGGDGVIPPGAQPSAQWRFKIIGHGTARPITGQGSLRAQTDAMLKVRIRAGTGLPLSSNSSWNIGFNCEAFQVTVGSNTQTAFVSRAGYTPTHADDPCMGSTPSWSYDFSASLSPGHQSVPIIINGAQYDNCRLHGNNVYSGGCAPLEAVYMTHPVDGYLEVFTD
jgi:hypothetical protein